VSTASWDLLGTQIRGCVRCPELAATRQSVVVGQWADRARLLLVGEAPGAEEDAAGEPFVGRAGQLLDLLLTEVGIDRSSCAVLNVLRCRPPANRAPKRQEIAACSGWLDAQRTLVAPELTVALGLTATKALMGKVRTLASIRGRVHPGGFVATYHPSAALRFGPAGAPMAGLREDLAMVAELLR
jgi:uracil-DNA glycosylase family 4